MDRAALQHLVEQRISSRLLPQHGATRIFASFGKGEPCSVCNRHIGSQEVLYTLTFANARLAMHLECFESWNRFRVPTTMSRFPG